jgi:hypothetical protein
MQQSLGRALSDDFLFEHRGNRFAPLAVTGVLQFQQPLGIPPGQGRFFERDDH